VIEHYLPVVKQHCVCSSAGLPGSSLMTLIAASSPVLTLRAWKRRALELRFHKPNRCTIAQVLKPNANSLIPILPYKAKKAVTTQSAELRKMTLTAFCRYCTNDYHFWKHSSHLPSFWTCRQLL